MRLRRPTAALLALSCTIVLAACGQGDPEAATESGGASESSGKLTKITMVQEWPVADGFWIPWTLGKEKGFYEEAGIDLEIVAPPTVADTMKFLGTGRADLAFTTIMDVVFAREQGAAVTSIGRYTDGNNWGLLTKAGDKITVEQLKGKTVGIYNDAWTKAQLGIMLADAGLKMSDIKTVSASDDTVPLLLRDKVDAITGVTNAEGTGIVTNGEKPGEFLPASEHGVPDSPVWVFAGNDEWLKANPELAKKFMAATAKSLVYAKDHPEEGVEAYFKAYSKAYDRSFITQQWKDTVALFEQSADGSWFSQQEDQWQPLLDAVKEHGIVKKVEPATAYFTNEYLEGGN
jgi:ABC-type nitrate/sulfonate/bicarbonate transport system substrate-binding protein